MSSPSYIIIDLEATCWEGAGHRDKMEIIEIGAVRLAGAAGPIVDEFSRFVRPAVEPKLSDFCRKLTSIRQEDVDSADDFPAVFSEFACWVGGVDFFLCSWGNYDLNQLRQDCRRHAIDLPPSFERHINLKEEFARQRGAKPCGMARALKMAGLPLQWTHHRGIDDAKNIAKLAIWWQSRKSAP